MLKPGSPEWRGITLEQALAAAKPDVANSLAKALAGSDLGFQEGLRLATVAGSELTALTKVADELRRRAVGDKITYVVNRNLNFTNVCIVGCAFCGFGRGADAPDAYFHSNETLIAKSVEAVGRGATEVCIQGGLPKDLDGYYYVQLLRAIKARLPELHIHAYSPMEITYGVEKTRLPLRDYLLMLKQAGLNSIPGTAAEILDDDVRPEAELADDRAIVGVVEVEGDQLLVARDGLPPERDAVAGLAPAPGVVAARVLDFDDFCSEVAEVRGDERPRVERREVEHLEAFEGHGLLGHSAPVVLI